MRLQRRALEFLMQRQQRMFQAGRNFVSICDFRSDPSGALCERRERFLGLVPVRPVHLGPRVVMTVVVGGTVGGMVMGGAVVTVGVGRLGEHPCWSRRVVHARVRLHVRMRPSTTHVVLLRPLIVVPGEKTRVECTERTKTRSIMPECAVSASKVCQKNYVFVEQNCINWRHAVTEQTF